MMLNTKKSAIIYFDFNANISPPTDTEIMDIPLVKDYKYLGLIINNRLTTHDHLENISRKINYLTLQLFPIRKRQNTKLNLNYFKIFIDDFSSFC